RRCRHGWREHNNHCYKLINEKVRFSTANQRCKGMGANLASIRDGQGNNFIASASDDMVWIGLQHSKWTDGSAVSYKNWAPGQPDDHWFYGGENCVVIYKK
ncbi:PREDICTED: snaclec coagulation factor IX/factor X-binding protein subunit A-like, partial [Branchiostoma belcheri]|uniref:Snaclec coagulation factor IX/factor X-binding protein subunit A-like n=1 Tax=Branchiostoma belcheri TaxID=7741 RepID=A0A6P5AY12_BRABE